MSRIFSEHGADRRRVKARLARRSVVGFVLVMLSGALHRVEGQITSTLTEADSAKAVYCQALASALIGISAEAAPDSLEAPLTRCDISGPVIIAAQWAAKTTGAGSGLEALVTASRFMLDERVFTAVQAAATDYIRADVVRIAALNVLASYVRPGAARVPLRETTDDTVLVFGTDIDTVSSDHPILGNGAERAFNTIGEVAFGGATNRRPSQPGRLATRKAPSSVRHAELPLPTNAATYAGHLFAVLTATRDIERFPITSPNVTLSYICGNKFSVHNSTPFGLVMTYEIVASGLPALDFRIRGAYGGGDIAEQQFTAPAAGTARLYHLGKLVGTADNLGTNCP